MAGLYANDLKCVLAESDPRADLERRFQVVRHSRSVVVVPQCQAVPFEEAASVQEVLNAEVVLLVPSKKDAAGDLFEEVDLGDS